MVARFEPTELGADAAVTTTPYGAGRVSYVATVPNPAFGRSLGRWLVAETAHSRWSAEDSVTVSTGTTDGSAVVFASNWSVEPTSIVAPLAVRDLVSGVTYAAGDSIPLERRSAVVLEATGDSTE